MSQPAKPTQPASAFLHTDPGISRPNNEDHIYSEFLPSGAGVYILCDGVGGHNAGEYASLKATEALTAALKTLEATKWIEANKKTPGLRSRHELKHLLQKWVNEASDAIHSEAQKDIKKLGMATTLELLVIIDRHAFLAHVGDSRTYLKRKNEIHLMTDDHTVGMELVRSGQAMLENAKKGPYWNVLSRAVGTHPHVKADVRDFELAEDDCLIMISDGVSDVLEAKDIAAFVSVSTVEQAPKKLVEEAKARKSKDNVSAIVVHVHEQTEATVNFGVIKKIEAIGKASLFRYCSYPDLTTVLNRFEYVPFKQGEEICKENTPADGLYVILTGEVSVLQKDKEVTIRKPGEIIGEMGVLEALPRSATLITKSKQVELLKLSRDQLISLLKEDQRLAVRLLWALCQEQSKRLRAATNEPTIAPEHLSIPDIIVPEK